jgi:hypothetical protein
LTPVSAQTTYNITQEWLRLACKDEDKALCHLYIDAFISGYRVGQLAYGVNVKEVRFCLPPGGLPLEALAAVFLAAPDYKTANGGSTEARIALGMTLGQKFPCPSKP